MSGLILPPQETTVIRGVAKSAALLFTLMLIERTYPGRPASEAELALLMQIDERTVRKQAQALSALGLVTAQGDRWLLTPDGRRTLFGANPQPTILSIENSEPTYLEGKISAQNVPHDMNDDDAKNVKSDSSSSLIDDTNCARTLQILRATATLFGEAVFETPDMSVLDPVFVLGWVAKIYADKPRLYNPLGTLYRRLTEKATGQERYSLPIMYCKSPARGLPSEFLREIGMEDGAANEGAYKTTSFSLDDFLPKSIEYTYPDAGDCDGYGRNLRWLEVLRDERAEIDGIERGIPVKRRGVFVGSEKVLITGNVMTVFFNKARFGKVGEFSNTFSKIYSDQCGDSSARVEFVSEEA